MSNIKKNSTMRFIMSIATLVLVLLDQGIKFLAVKLLPKYETVAVIPSVLHLTLVKNFGAVFGIFQNKKIFLVLVTVAILIFLLAFIVLNKIESDILLWSISLIFAGGIGNLIDRICHGYVIDYIDFRLINFWVFNLADSFICIGAILMVIYYLFIEPKQNLE